MGLYALGITLLITAVTSPSRSMHHSSKNPFYNVAFADNITGCGKLEFLKQWLDKICRLGPFIGYYINLIKTWLIKDHELEKAF